MASLKVDSAATGVLAPFIIATNSVVQ